MSDDEHAYVSEDVSASDEENEETDVTEAALVQVLTSVPPKVVPIAYSYFDIPDIVSMPDQEISIAVLTAW